MDMIQQTNKELLLEIITEFKIIRNEIKEIKNILKDNEENEQSGRVNITLTPKKDNEPAPANTAPVNENIEKQ